MKPTRCSLIVKKNVISVNFLLQGMYFESCQQWQVFFHYLGHHLTQSLLGKKLFRQTNIKHPPVRQCETGSLSTSLFCYRNISKYFSYKIICLMMHKSIQERKKDFCNSSSTRNNCWRKGFTRITRCLFNKDIDIYCNWWFICPMTKTESMLQIRLVFHYLCFPTYNKKTVLFDKMIWFIGWYNTETFW